MEKFEILSKIEENILQAKKEYETTQDQIKKTEEYLARLRASLFNLSGQVSSLTRLKEDLSKTNNKDSESDQSDTH